MKLPVPVRMTEFLIAFAVVVAVIIFTERSAWRQISRLRQDLHPEVIERVRSADRLRAAILEMHTVWSDALNDNSATNRTLFASAHTNLAALLQWEMDNSVSGEERNLLQAIMTESQAYHLLALKASEPDKPPRLEREVAAHLHQLLALSEKLRLANETATQRLLDAAGASLTRLQAFLFVALLGVLLCGVVILVLTYRRMVGPLRSSLAESRILMERQEKLASLGVFATGIAHEVRNPITAIKVRLFTLKSSHQPDSGDFEDLDVIESEISRLERIVQEFLRFARPAEPELMTVPIDSFLRDVYELLLPELNKRKLHFQLDLNAKETVQIDPEKMKQVLLNFIQNAADAIEGEGIVTLSSATDRRLVDGRVLAAVVIEITDTGKGMPPEVQKRLFDPFFTTKEKGTGLGLPIAARIVEKHGGLIQYRTRPDHGTTFTILLPRSDS